MSSTRSTSGGRAVCSKCVVSEANVEKLTKERDEANQALVQERDAHTATKALLKQAEEDVKRLTVDNEENKTKSERNEAMAIEVVRHLYFSVKLDGSGKKDGSLLIEKGKSDVFAGPFLMMPSHTSLLIVFTFHFRCLDYAPPRNLKQHLLEWGLDTFQNCGFHTFQSIRTQELGRKILLKLNTDNGTRRGYNLVCCVKRVARNSTMYRSGFTGNMETECKSKLQIAQQTSDPKSQTCPLTHLYRGFSIETSLQD